nr:disease resistance protein Pik-2-like isoform X2 [Setaria viridis]
MEATALSVGKSVLNGALGYAKSAFAEEVALQLGIQRDHAFVADELEMMQSFMMEAHEERDDNKVVKTWVKQVRDTAYDVEDSLQDFAVRVERPSWWRFPRKLLERRRVAKKMKELRAKVEDVSQRNVRYRLIKGSGSKATAATVQSSIIAAAIFGVDDARRAAKENQRVDLVQLINKEDDDLRVIAVWGTGGDIGQTSIIRAAYKNPDTQRKFPSRAWVRVTHPFSSEGFVRSLVNQFLAVEGFKDILDTEKTAHDLVQEFDGYVKEKRFLIVLTNLCTIEEWDQIEKCLPNNNKGSRIIVSTTQVEVASLCAGQDSQASELKQLSADHTLYAFYDKVFGKAADFVKQNPEFVEEANQNLKKYGGLPLVKATDLIKKNPELFEETKKILKKCGGLPLAIVTIGGYLASRPKTRAEWRKLNENISAELEMNPELGMIRTVLQTSYDGLPYELKSCFLYLSIFPEDHIISQRRLVHRWTVEGYSHERRGKSANEMAENYFTQLKYRSMILPFQQSVRSRKSIDSCKVHDLIRDIAISKSMEENLVFRLEEGCGLSTHGAIRHLAISSNWKGDQSELERIVDLSRLRSLTVFGEFRPFYISDKMRLLRVLDLEDIDDLKYHQLDHIWKLVHLKYLSLRGCSGIDLLPDLLGNLRQLQVLDVRGTCIMALPKTIIKLRKLQYIHAGQGLDYGIGEKYSLTRRCLWGAGLCATCCAPVLWDIDGPLHKALTRRDAYTFACCVKFPAVMTGVYAERGAMVPRGTRKLKELHTLREVHVGRGNAVLQDIKMLTGLRKLGVAGINRKNGPAFRAAISNLSRLESLSVSSAGYPGLRGCLDAISSPPENLQSLKLYGNMETLPQWIKQLPHLVKLKLVCTRLLEHDDAMEFLGKLSKLEILSLSWQSFQGEELRFRSQQTGRAFGSLRVLMLAYLWGIKSVKFEEGIMPKLERLQVRGQVNNEIEFSGLEFLQSINEVHLSVYIPDCETRETIEERRQEERRKKGELKKKVQEQLARNRNEPILTFDNTTW